jgi:hypothetical protein
MSFKLKINSLLTILNIEDVDGNGYYDVNDFLEMNNKEILDMNEGKRFGICLINPPYNAGKDSGNVKSGEYSIESDFINKLNIALKEADETGLWLELLHESDYLSDSEFDSVYDDNQKIVATLINIIKKTKE